MCGICGTVSRTAVNPAVSENMCAAMIHRGPDDSGIFVNSSKTAMLGMRRLSIIDLETGAQPMFNEDKKLAVVFNGAVYNYRELRRKLEPRHRFATNSDTEVIVHLYEEKGPECLNDFNGMFAVALWDQRRKTLFLARDRMGRSRCFTPL